MEREREREGERERERKGNREKEGGIGGRYSFQLYTDSVLHHETVLGGGGVRVCNLHVYVQCLWESYNHCFNPSPFPSSLCL